jgi:uncharacterized membrane protein YebE (DUF533 family)
MQNDDEILQSLIVGGTIGAALAALLSNGKKETTRIGALAGAAILATLRANENAKKTNVPVYIEENNIIYEVNSKGEKKFIKMIEKSTHPVPLHYKLK